MRRRLHHAPRVARGADSFNLAAIAAARGARTLMIDLVPQANSTKYLLCAAAQELEHSKGQPVRLKIAMSQVLLHMDVLPWDEPVARCYPELCSLHSAN